MSNKYLWFLLKGKIEIQAFKYLGFLGNWVTWLSDWLLIWTQVMISGSWDWALPGALCWALRLGQVCLYLSVCSSLLSLSLIDNKIFQKNKNETLGFSQICFCNLLAEQLSSYVAVEE